MPTGPESFCRRHGLSVSSLAFYDNNLHPDQAERAAINAHVLACVDAAALLGCPTVGTFIGRDPGKSVAENLREAEKIFPPLVDSRRREGRADRHRELRDGGLASRTGIPGNLAYSPELWEWMFSLGLYLNYDPSHLVWIGIDPVTRCGLTSARWRTPRPRTSKSFLAPRNRYGYPGKAVQPADPWDTGWWRYRVPGLGQVDWTRVMDTLYEGGFDGVLSVEHEDPVWGGTEDRIEAGLGIACRTLKPLIIR